MQFLVVNNYGRILSNYWLAQLNYLGINLKVKGTLTLYIHWISEFHF